MSSGKNVFITVGTTEFDELVREIDDMDFIRTLKDSGFTSATVQIGRGVHEPSILSSNCSELVVEVYRFKPTLDDDMKRADLIISHCGAGSILEAVKYEKELIVVVNNSLQDNHQTELADAMSEAGYCVATVPKQLRKVLQARKDSQVFPVLAKKKMSDIPITDPSHFCKAVSDMYDFST
jgi:beta-1,4-N-acetylglucosaminyltransferase